MRGFVAIVVFLGACAVAAGAAGAFEQCREGESVELVGKIREVGHGATGVRLWMSRTDPCEVAVFEIPVSGVGPDCRVGAEATAVGIVDRDKEPWSGADMLVLRAATVACRLLHTTN